MINKLNKLRDSRNVYVYLELKEPFTKFGNLKAW